MDLLLGGFFKKNYQNLTEHELLEFRDILELTDKALSDWLIINKSNKHIENIGVSKKIKEFSYVSYKEK